MAVVSRLQEVPAYIDGLIETLEEGIRANFTLAKESLGRTRKQFDKILIVEDVTKSPFFKPFDSLKENENILANAREDIESLAKKIIKDKVVPAFKKLNDFVQDEYSPKARAEPGVWSLPNGKKFYQKCLEYHTTIKGITAKEVHDIGLQSIEELKTNVLKIAKDIGKGDLDFKEFLAFLRDSPDLKFKSKEEALELLNSVLYEKINPQLKNIFPESLLRDDVYKVDIAVPKGSGGTAFYVNPSKDGTRNGTYYINLNNLNNFQKTIATTLTLHEANPGHHFQVISFLKQGTFIPNLLFL